MLCLPRPYPPLLGHLGLVDRCSLDLVRVSQAPSYIPRLIDTPVRNTDRVMVFLPKTYDLLGCHELGVIMRNRPLALLVSQLQERCSQLYLERYGFAVPHYLFSNP